MNDDKDILARALRELRSEPVPPGPSRELAQKALRNLAQCRQARNPLPLPFGYRAGTGQTLIRVAASVILLILAGFAGGRLSAPRQLDLAELHGKLHGSIADSLKPALRDEILEELDHRWQLVLARTCANVKAQLTSQYRQELDRFAIQTLAASNATTNQLLTELVQTLRVEKTRDLRTIAAAIDQIERNRLEDRSRLVGGIEQLAYLTDGRIRRTKDDLVRLLVYGQPTVPADGFAPTHETPNERNEP